jgi:ribokinase
MRVINFGSVNIDHVYEVDHFVRPGETLSSESYRVFAGGKGFNQSIALARAGARVAHVGKIGQDGEWLLEKLSADGVDTAFLRTADQPTGHAVIQVNRAGENAIVLFPGANHCLEMEQIDEMLATCAVDDWLLIQNETNAVAEIIERGARRGLHVVFNPAPMTADVLNFPLDRVALFIMNETEAHTLTNESEPDQVCRAMKRKFPQSATVLTRGGDGALYVDAHSVLHQPAKNVTAIDSTAAGDTFIGFFLADYLQQRDPRRALAIACHAAAICVTRRGAADSIPRLSDLGEE